MAFKWILASFVLCFPTNVFAQKSLKLPYLDRGACPFECCIYRTWTAGKDISLRKEMRAASPIVFRIKRGERVQGLTGVVVTNKAGIVEAVRDTKFDGQNIKNGSRLQILTYGGEGFYKAWYRGKVYEDAVEANTDLKIISQPDSVWWVKIKNRKGQTGWTNLSDSFDNQDSCG